MSAFDCEVVSSDTLEWKFNFWLIALVVRYIYFKESRLVDLKKKQKACEPTPKALKCYKGSCNP